MGTAPAGDVHHTLFSVRFAESRGRAAFVV